MPIKNFGRCNGSEIAAIKFGAEPFSQDFQVSIKPFFQLRSRRRR